MAKPKKTRETEESVQGFLDSLDDDQKREDSIQLIDIISGLTKEQPKMWGPSIIGFGSYRIRYASGKESDWFLVGFSPRKQNLTLYLLDDAKDEEELLSQIGPHKTGKCCLYFKRLEVVHLPTLKKLIRKTLKRRRKNDVS